MRLKLTALSNGVIALACATAMASTAPKPATNKTKSQQHNVQYSLPFKNKTDFELASKHLMAKPDQLTINNADGKAVWDLTPFASFIKTGANSPATVNPSLWRMAQLNMYYGLYRVTKDVYQVRGYDLSVMTIISTNTGYVVVDPLISSQTAKAAMELVYTNVARKPVVGVIYTHSHVDHFGGVKGIVSEADVRAGKVSIIAPKGFMEAAISENVMAGNAMSRRAQYMYGSLLPKNAQGQVDGGLGKTVSSGTVTLIAPTQIVQQTPTNTTIDGREFVFQFTPNTEAPAEMNFYLPQLKALCMAENATHTMHNLYTLRGARVRDAHNWVKYLNQSIELFGAKSDVVFASHHWPIWGSKNIVEYLQNQRDMYKYIHDQTLRLANHGYNMDQIAEQVHLPKSLANNWYNRDYYGTVNHNVKAVFQRYLGWFDGNPAHLNPLPPVSTSKNMVQYMGGAQAAIEKARKDFATGQYRWVAQAMNYVVFADPHNKDARNLGADALEQLGYQSESGPWRNFYLTGAQELRDGVVKHAAPETASPDIVAAMDLNSLFDFLAVHLNGPKANGRTIKMQFNFPDIDRKYYVLINNSVLNYYPNRIEPNADVTVSIDRKLIDKIVLGKTDFVKEVESGAVKVGGDLKKLAEFSTLFDHFDPWFNIVTPRGASA